MTRDELHNAHLARSDEIDHIFLFRNSRLSRQTDPPVALLPMSLGIKFIESYFEKHCFSLFLAQTLKKDSSLDEMRGGWIASEARDCADAAMVRCSHRREEFQIILGVRNLGKQGNLNPSSSASTMSGSSWTGEGFVLLEVNTAPLLLETDFFLIKFDNWMAELESRVNQELYIWSGTYPW